MQGIGLGFSQESINRLRQQFDSLIKELNAKGQVNINIDSVNREIGRIKTELNNLLVNKPINLKVNTAQVESDLKKTVSTIDEAIQHYEQLGKATPARRVYDENGNLKKFIVDLERTEGLIERISYEGSNFQDLGNGNLKAIGFSPTSVVEIDKVAQEEEKAQQRIQDAIGKTIQKREEENKLLEEAQAKASNKALDDQYQAQLKEQQRVANLGEVKGTFDPSLLEKSNSEIKEYVQNMYGADAKVVSFKKSVDGANNSIVKMTVNTKNNKNEIQQEKVVLDQATSSVYKQEEAVKANTSRMVSFSDRLKNAFVAVSSFATVTGAFYGAIRQLQQGIEIINSLNTAQTNIAMITGMSSEQVQQLTKDYSDLASQLHETTTSIMTASEEFLRAGNDTKQTSELLKASTVMSKIAGQDQKETADQLIAIMNSYKMSSSDMMSVVDKMTSVDNSSATSTKELGAAIEKTASSAQMAGVSFDQLVSYIGTVSSVSRKSADSIGESFKTIFARYQDVKGGKNFDINGEDISNVERDFRKYAGVEIRDSVGTFRDFSVVLDELSKKWNTLSQAEQSGLAKAIAGTRQRENFLILMGNMSTALDLQTKQANSSGNALQRYDTYAESTQAHLADLEQTAQKMWMNLISSSSINSVIAGANTLLKTFGNLKSAISLIATAFLIFKGKTVLDFFTTLPAKISSSVKNMELFNVTSSAIKASQLGLISTTEALGLSFTALGTTIKAAFLSNPLGWIAIGITTIVSAIDIFNQKQEEAKQKQEELIQQMNDSVNAMKSVEQETANYNKLLEEQQQIQGKSKDKQTAEEKQRLHDIEVQLAQAVPDATTSYDAQNQALAENVDLTKQLIQLKEQDAINKAGDIIGSFDPDTTLDKTKRLKELLEVLKQIKSQSHENNMVINATNVPNIDVYNNDKYKDLLSTQDVKAISNARTWGDLLKAITKVQSELSTEEQKGIKSLNDYNKAVEYYNQKTGEKWKIVVDEILGTKLSTQATQDNTKAIEDNAKANSDNADSLKKAQDAFESSTTKMEFYKNALDELNDKHVLSGSTVKAMFKDYPELLAYIGNETALRQKLNELIQQEGNTQRQVYMSMIMTSEEYYNAQIKGTNIITDALKQYGINLTKEQTAELNNAKSLAEARQLIEAKLIGNLGDMWQQYYEASLAAAEQVNNTAYDSYKYVIMGGGGTPEQQAEYKRLQSAGSSLYNTYQKIIGAFDSIGTKISLPNFDSINNSGVSSGSKSAEDAAKKAEEAQQNAYQAIEDINSKLMDAIKQQVEEEKKALDERLDNYKNFINDKLKALDDEYTTEDRKRKLDEEAKKKAELEAQKNELLLDNSPEAKALRNNLDKQIQDQQQVIDDLNRDYSREDQKANLNKQLEDFEKQINDQKAQIDAKYTDEEIAKLAKSGLQTGLVNIGNQTISVRQLLIDAMQKSGEAFEATGQKLQTELLDRLVKVQQLMQNMNGDGTINGNVALNIMGSHADGGIIDYTGLAQLHGSTTNPEVIFNASQASKLFNFVKNLPTMPYKIPNIPIIPNSNGSSIQIGSIIGTVQGSVDKSTLPILQKMIEDRLPIVVAEAQMNNNKKLGNYNPRVK